MMAWAAAFENYLHKLAVMLKRNQLGFFSIFD